MSRSAFWRTLSFPFACVTLTLLPGPRAPAQTYAIEDLGTLGGAASKALGINDRRQVVGSSETGERDRHGLPVTHAFLWEDGVMTDLGTDPVYNERSAAYDINDAGQVCGVSGFVGFGHRAVVWEEGRVRQLARQGGDDSGRGINERGDVVGTAGSDVVGSDRAVLWSADGRAADLGRLPGSGGLVDVSASDINNYGEVVGRSIDHDGDADHAFLFTSVDGTMTDLGTLGGGYSSAQGINDFLEVAGSSTVAGEPHTHACLWREGGIVDLGTLGGQNSSAEDLNAHGQVVGWAEAEDGSRRAFLWDAGRRPMADLNDLIPTGSGWELTIATAINDRGEIVGSGMIGGEVHGFLLTSMSSPARFRRGDADATGAANVTDAVFVLSYLFRGGPAPPCLKSADSDDSGAVEVSDAIQLLNYLFRGGVAPREPFRACAVDPTPDGLSCHAPPPCR
ncbi:MAG: DUF3466 family protein [Planctomycetes bacterium]|nr:DUF3466 family protein [Planctomycetota bacterium]